MSAETTTTPTTIEHLDFFPRMGDIGEPVKRIELEPFPEQVPVVEPALPEPVREPEKVPS